MKKYEKPIITFENFALSKNVGNDCEVSPGDEELDFGYVGILFTANESCSFIPDNMMNGELDGGDNGICYHTFQNGINLFNS